MARRPPYVRSTPAAIKSPDAASLTSPPVLDRVNAPELIIDGFTGASHSNGLIRINLHVDRYDVQAGTMRRVIVQRLTLTPDTLYSLTNGLQDVLTRMVETGSIIPPPGWINVPKEENE